MFEKKEDLSNEEYELMVMQELALLWRLDLYGWSEYYKNTTTAIPICSWDGMSCDDTNSITDLELSNKNISSEIPSILSLLPSIRSIDLSENNITGLVPFDVRQTSTLKSLNLSHNRIEGSIEYFSPTLQVLNVSHNNFQEIGITFGQYETGLEKIDASRNNIGGSLPRTIGNMLKLHLIDLSHNQIYGTIPPTISDLTQLKNMVLNNNKLMGTLPVVSLTQSHLDLSQIHIQHNDLSGTIPSGIANIKFLKELLIDGNKFTGELHENVCNLKLNKIANDWQGAEEIDQDACELIACPVNTASDDGRYPCKRCGAQKYTPYLGHNGQCSPSDEGVILNEVYHKTNGPAWRNHAGWGMDGVDKCDYAGVECNGSGHVMSLNLKGVGLTGTLPEEIGMLRQLQFLDLSENNLTGYLPSDLRFSPLRLFDISNNMIGGIIPPLMCLTGDVNGNGMNGDYNCDMIACPSGTWSPSGRATPRPLQHSLSDKNGHHTCKPCRSTGSRFIGRTACNGLHIFDEKHRSDSASDMLGVDLILSIASLIATIIILTLCIIVRHRRFVGDENVQMHLAFRDADNDGSDTESYQTECTGTSSIHLKKLDPDEESVAKDDIFVENYPDDVDTVKSSHSPLMSIGEDIQDNGIDVSTSRRQSYSSTDSDEPKRLNPELWLDVPSI